LETREAFKVSMDNMQWFTENYEMLKKDFKDKWVAVSGHRVVESAKDLPTLARAIAKCEGSEAFVVEFVRAEPVAMFF
jgi:hypothetical protein